MAKVRLEAQRAHEPAQRATVPWHTAECDYYDCFENGREPPADEATGCRRNERRNSRFMVGEQISPGDYATFRGCRRTQVIPSSCQWREAV